MDDNSNPDADVMLAIAALGSLKTGTAAATTTPTTVTAVRGPSRTGTRPSEISLPPISSLVSRDDETQRRGSSSSSARDSSGGGSGSGPPFLPSHMLPHPPYTGYNPSASSTASASSTSALTFSPATTPSANTVTSTSASSPAGSPTRMSDSGAPHSAISDRPPYSSVYVRTGEARPGIDTPADTASIFSFGENDPDLSNSHSPGTTPQGDEGFIGRVAQFPIVSGALRVYERGRNSSRVVKYGTDLVESSVKTISKPVINRVVGPSLAGQLDDFACRQLDRFGPRGSPKNSPHPLDSPIPSSQAEKSAPTAVGSSTSYEASYFPPPEAYYRRPHGKGRAINGTEGEYGDDVSLPSPISETPTLESHHSQSTTHSAFPISSSAQHQQIVRSASAGNRSRWQSLVIEAGVTAGGIGAAVSEESMKSLKYCLHWLHYATAHLDHQIGILREFILSLTSQHRHSSSAALVTNEDARAADILNGIKRDVVETIRKVVNVVSTYAGAALPEQAKRYVRNSILSLPEKWAQASAFQQIENGPSPASSSSAGASVNGTSATDGVHQSQSVVMSGTQQAAERTLTFAVESLDMLSGVLNIFTDSVERADAWIERLRIVGLQRQQAMSGQSRRGMSSTLANGVRRSSSSGGAIAGSSPLAGTTTSSAGLKRREDDATLDEDAEMHQRRKNSRTSLVRDTSSMGEGDIDENSAMEIDA